MENNYDIDDLYRDKFQGLEIQPGLNSFDKVVLKLGAAKRKKRRRFFFYLFSGVSAISLLTYLGSFLLSTTNSENSSAILLNTKEINDQSAAITNFETLPVTTNKNNAQNNLTTPKNNTSGSDFSSKNEPPISSEQNEKKIPEKSIPGNVTSLKTNSFRTVRAKFNENNANSYSDSEKTDSSQITSDISRSVFNDQNGSAQKKVPKPVSGLVQFPDILAFKRINELPVTPYSNTIVSTTIDSDLLDKLYLSLKAKDFKTNFFVAANYLLLFYGSDYKKNPNTSHKTAYGDDFSDFYVANRNDQKKRDFVGVPGLKIGLINQNKWELGIGFGYYKLKISETILYPEADTSKTPTTITPFNITSANTNRLNTLTYENEYRYFYYSADVSRVIKLNRYNLKPGVGINFSHALKSSYIMVDTSGYVYNEKKQDHLNRNTVNLSFKLGLSRKLTKNMDYQVTPTYVLGLNSIFDSNYFLSQKLRGIGLEAALIYTIRSK